jgi:ABC-type sugar transport system substrate-binding protein
VLVIGTDRTPEQIAAIKDKTVLATITQATEVEEYVSLYYLKWLRDGKGVPDVTITPAFVIDASNVDTLS